MPLRAMARAANRLVPVWGRCVPLGATVCVGVLMGVTGVSPGATGTSGLSGVSGVMGSARDQAWDSGPASAPGRGGLRRDHRVGGLEGEGLAADGDDIISVFILQDRIVRAIQQSVQIHDELRDLIAVRIHGGIGIPAIVSIFVAINIPAINGVAAVHQCPVVVLADPAQDQHIPVLVLGGTGRRYRSAPAVPAWLLSR